MRSYAEKFEQCFQKLRDEADQCKLKVPEIMIHSDPSVPAMGLVSRVKRSSILRRSVESDERVMILLTECCEEERKKLIGCSQAKIAYDEQFLKCYD